MKLKLTFALCIIISLCVPNLSHATEAIKEDSSTGQFYSSCKQIQSTCLSYITGFMTGLSYGRLEFSAQKHDAMEVSFCIDKDVVLKTMAHDFTEWIEYIPTDADRERFMTLPVHQGFYSFLKSNYKCK